MNIVCERCNYIGNPSKFNPQKSIMTKYCESNNGIMEAKIFSKVDYTCPNCKYKEVGEYCIGVE